jgi:hypothetical protein
MTSVDPQKAIVAKAKEVEEEAQSYLSVIATIVLETSAQFTEAAELAKEFAHKWKVFDQERKVTVKPLNDEVDRINDWFRPGLTKLKQAENALRAMMSTYVIAQQREEARLTKLAQEAALKALATADDPTGETKALLKEAAAAAVPDVKGVGTKVRWTWRVVDATKLRKEFLKTVPDEEALAAWVATHGDKDVPEGLEVTPDARFTLRR